MYKANISASLKALCVAFTEHILPKSCGSRFGDRLSHTSFWVQMEKKKLIEISCDHGLKINLKNMPLIYFWLNIRHEYPLLIEKAIAVLLPFSTTYLCEKAFYTNAHMNTEYRSIHALTWPETLPFTGGFGLNKLFAVRSKHTHRTEQNERMKCNEQ